MTRVRLNSAERRLVSMRIKKIAASLLTYDYMQVHAEYRRLYGDIVIVPNVVARELCNTFYSEVVETSRSNRNLYRYVG